MSEKTKHFDCRYLSIADQCMDSDNLDWKECNGCKNANTCEYCIWPTMRGGNFRCKYCGVKEKTMIQIETKTAYCASRHLATYHNQHAEMKEANFAEPCEACRYWDECKGDFTRTLSDLMVDHKFKIARDSEVKND